MSQNLISVIGRLVTAEVDFVVIGGFAATVYGSTLVTQDVDICCSFTQENLLRLQKAMSGINPVHRMTPKRLPLVLTPENSRDLKNLYLDTDLGVLDCLGDVSGIGNFETVKEASVLIETESLKFRILSLDALIEAKKAMNRPRDKQTLAILMALKERQERE